MRYCDIVPQNIFFITIILFIILIIINEQISDKEL